MEAAKNKTKERQKKSKSLDIVIYPNFKFFEQVPTHVKLLVQYFKTLNQLEYHFKPI